MLNLILAFIAGGLVVFIGISIFSWRLAGKVAARRKSQERVVQDWGPGTPISWRGQKGENRDPEIS